MTILYGQDSDVGRLILDGTPPWSRIVEPSTDLTTNIMSVEKQSSVVVYERNDSTVLINSRLKLGISECGYTLGYPTYSRDTLEDAQQENNIINDFKENEEIYVKKYISWAKVQPSVTYLNNSNGNPTNNLAYNWNLWGETGNEYDDIQLAIDNGFKIVLVIHCNQSDATLVTNELDGNFPIGDFGGKSGALCWDYFLKAIITKYGSSNIYAWEIVDKADINWKGSVYGAYSYGSLIKRTKTALNQYGGENRLFISLSGGNQTAQNFFYQPIGSPTGLLLEARTISGQILFEALDIHLVSEDDLANPNKSQFENLLTMALPVGNQLAFCSTEFKISSTGGTLFGGTEEKQALDIVKVTLSRAKENWILLLYSSLIDDEYGLMSIVQYPYSETKKPSYTYYQSLFKILQNSIFETVSQVTNLGKTIDLYRFRVLGRYIFLMFGDVGVYQIPDYDWSQAVGRYLTNVNGNLLIKIGSFFEINYTGDIYFIEQYENTTSAPDFLRVQIDSSNLRLEWEASQDTSVNSYNIYRGKTGETIKLYATTNELYYIDNSIESNQEYAYYVKSINASGGGIITFRGIADDDQGLHTNSGLDVVELIITKGASSITVTTDITFLNETNYPYVDSEWKYDWIPLEGGEYLIQSRAKDLAGNIEQIPLSSRTIIIDIIGPTIVIDEPVDNLRTNEAIEIKGRAFDDFSGVESVTMTVDGIPVAVTGIEDWNVLWTPTSDGTHLVRVTARDYAGNESIATVHIISDTTMPYLIARILEGNILRKPQCTIRIQSHDEGSIVGWMISKDSAFPALNDARWNNIEPTIDFIAEVTYNFITGE